ncbi:hypothetical protein TNCV_3673171 [Trichonephila clavipes]|nr:hypothetical protein TNCV_3673171 [Trichonephila clavipes]
MFKVRSFASSVFISFLGFGWKTIVINSGPKNPRDLLKKRRVRCHKSLGVSKKHQKAKWMQHRRLFSQLVGLLISMNAPIGWDTLKNDLSSGAKN